MPKKNRPRDGSHSDDLKDELGLAVKTRRELGEQYEDEVVEALAERIETYIDQRVKAALAGKSKATKGDAKAFLAVAMPTMGIGIPLLAIGAGVAGAGGFYAVLGMIFLINVVWLLRSR
jgi:hypothetical protein